jgi:hypothetical protein
MGYSFKRKLWAVDKVEEALSEGFKTLISVVWMDTFHVFF